VLVERHIVPAEAPLLTSGSDEILFLLIVLPTSKTGVTLAWHFLAFAKE
jgi:hypothetical protein